jgi:diadenosine tetraphosphate (Ap4A) HIT family hydrolase
VRNAFVSRHGISDRELRRGEIFRVLPTLGQLTEGHLLILPSRHVTSLANLASDESNELEGICTLVRTTLQQVYGQVLFFEHGIRGKGAGGCGIDHAHMHAVPVNSGGLLDILIRHLDGSAIRNLSQINEAIKPESSYLFFEDSSANRHVFQVKDLPSQYMRKLVGESIGKLDWDWRKCGYEPELLATLERLTPLLSSAASVSGA